MATNLDYSVMTENRFGAFSDTTMDMENGDGFQVVRNKRRCTVLSPCDKQSFADRSVDEKLNVLFSEIREIRDSQTMMQTGMSALFENQVKIGETVKLVYSFANNNTDMIRLLSYKSIDLEARQRRNNLIFRHMLYKRGENCFELVRDFLEQRLDLDTSDIYLERAHPFGPYNKKDPTRRDIIVCLRDYHDTTRIMSRVGNLRDTQYFIDRDYPREVTEARRRLWPRFKAAKAEHRQSGGTVQIQFPAKLVVNGTVVCDEFPKWGEVMRGSRDRSFGHIRYDDKLVNVGMPAPAMAQNHPYHTTTTETMPPFQNTPQRTQYMYQSQGSPNVNNLRHGLLYSSDTHIQGAHVAQSYNNPDGDGVQYSFPPSTSAPPTRACQLTPATTRNNDGTSSSPEAHVGTTHAPVNAESRQSLPISSSAPRHSDTHVTPPANSLTMSQEVHMGPTSTADIATSGNRGAISPNVPHHADRETSGDNTRSDMCSTLSDTSARSESVISSVTQPSIFRPFSPSAVPKNTTHTPQNSTHDSSRPNNSSNSQNTRLQDRPSRSATRKHINRQSQSSARAPRENVRQRDQRSSSAARGPMDTHEPPSTCNTNTD